MIHSKILIKKNDKYPYLNYVLLLLLHNKYFIDTILYHLNPKTDIIKNVNKKLSDLIIDFHNDINNNEQLKILENFLIKKKILKENLTCNDFIYNFFDYLKNKKVKLHDFQSSYIKNKYIYTQKSIIDIIPNNYLNINNIFKYIKFKHISNNLIINLNWEPKKVSYENIDDFLTKTLYIQSKKNIYKYELKGIILNNLDKYILYIKVGHLKIYKYFNNSRKLSNKFEYVKGYKPIILIYNKTSLLDSREISKYKMEKWKKEENLASINIKISTISLKNEKLQIKSINLIKKNKKLIKKNKKLKIKYKKLKEQFEMLKYHRSY